MKEKKSRCILYNKDSQGVIQTTPRTPETIGHVLNEAIFAAI